MTTITHQVVYPETDGKPMAENTLQYQWIVTIASGLDALYADDPDVFVAADLFWYPIEGDDITRIAPDVMVAFGRPRGRRGSYQQWNEGNIAPQVVFEIVSPGHRAKEMAGKLAFYDRFGVEEYYHFDPNPKRLKLGGYVRAGGGLTAVRPMNRHVSPRLRIRFEMGDEGLRIIGPDGAPFPTALEIHRQKVEAQRQAERERLRAEQAIAREAAALREAERLRERLRALGQNPQ